MINKTLITNSIIAIVIILVLFFGYKYFSGSSTPAATTTPGLVPAGYLSGDQQQSTDEFLSILNDLQGVKLNGEIFGTDFFRSLNDMVTVLPTETPGRANPFAPLGVGGAINLTSTASSTLTTPAAKKGATAAPSSGGDARDQLLKQLGL